MKQHDVWKSSILDVEEQLRNRKFELNPNTFASASVIDSPNFAFVNGYEEGDDHQLKNIN